MCVVLLIVGLTLGVIGISVWGLVEGLKKTDGRVSTFWNLVGDGRTQVGWQTCCHATQHAISASEEWHIAYMFYVHYLPQS